MKNMLHPNMVAGRLGDSGCSPDGFRDPASSFWILAVTESHMRGAFWVLGSWAPQGYLNQYVVDHMEPDGKSHMDSPASHVEHSLQILIAAISDA